METKTWQETVLTQTELDSLFEKYQKKDPNQEKPFDGVIAKKQAEITGDIAYKAGVSKGYNAGLLEGQADNHIRHGKKMRQAKLDGMKAVVEWLRQYRLLIADEPPVEGKPYQFLACYITRFGNTDEPLMGLIRLSESVELEAFLKDNGLDVIKK